MKSAKAPNPYTGLNSSFNALYLKHLEEGANAHLGDATTLGDVKELAPGQAH